MAEAYEWALAAALTLAWHTLRAWLLAANGRERFADLLVLRAVRGQREQTAYRNAQHALLATLHCAGSVLLTSCLAAQHWDESWDEWFGRRTAAIDARHALQPAWAVAFSLSYFASDFAFIFDFPVYWVHHVLSVFLGLISLAVVEMRFMGVVVLWCAEVGGLMLTLYLRRRTLCRLRLFCAGYGASRLLFSYVAYRLWVSSRKSDRVVDDVCAALVVVLVGVNWAFWLRHVRKLLARS